MNTSEESWSPRKPFVILDVFKTAMASMSLKEKFAKAPIGLHRTYQTNPPVKFPKVIEDAYAAIWSGRYSRIIIKAPRGGGKSKLLGTAGFDLWYLKDRSVVNMGGSLVQANIVYGYFKDYCEIDPSILHNVAGNVTMDETRAITGNRFSCVTASEKAVRGKHPDVLISDETCETDDALVHSALPMVNDSEHPLVVMASTFHKIYGIFQETWDSAEQRGYHRIQWDIFDVCKPFEAKIWEREDVKKISGIDKLRKYANGRTGDPEGWVPIENIFQAWKEKPTEDWFEVEYLGSRPSAAGLVLKPEDVDAAVFDETVDKRYNYQTGATVVLGIDWGFSSMTSVTEWMGYTDGLVAMLDNNNYHQTPSEDIINAIVSKVRAHGIRMIYADSAGKFENVALQNALAKAGLGCAVIEVVFSKEKYGTPGPEGSLGMLGNLRAHFEQRKIKIPKRFRDAFWQYKRYRYQEGTDKAMKKDDHIPDSTMCALQHFKLGQFVRSIPTQSISDRPKRRTEPEPVRMENDSATSALIKKVF